MINPKKIEPGTNGQTDEDKDRGKTDRKPTWGQTGKQKKTDAG